MPGFTGNNWDLKSWDKTIEHWGTKDLGFKGRKASGLILRVQNNKIKSVFYSVTPKKIFLQAGFPLFSFKKYFTFFTQNPRFLKGNYRYPVF
jgi:hypothetical protein